MATKRKILLQLDTDPRPSSFDAVVAVDAGVDFLLPYGGVDPENVRDLVYGAIFTRGPEDLHSTAIFVGGSNVARGEEVLAAVRGTFFGPLSVSAMLDCGGANTTAAAAVIAAMREFDGDEPLAGRRAAVLGSTGPVGRRVVRLLAACGAEVIAGSRSAERAQSVADDVNAAVDGPRVTGAATSSPDELAAVIGDREVIVAAGGLGVCLLPREARAKASDLRVAIDLNAVPPEGIEGVTATTAGAESEGGEHTVWGAIGVGGIKMKIHKACVARLFESRDRVFDAEAVLEVGRSL